MLDIENVSLDLGATIEYKGEKIPAKDFLCEFKDIVITGLHAAIALIKNPIVKAIVGTIAEGLIGIIKKTCG